MGGNEQEVLQVMIQEVFSQREKYDTDSLYYVLWTKVLYDLERIDRMILLREKWNFTAQRRKEE